MFPQFIFVFDVLTTPYCFLQKYIIFSRLQTICSLLLTLKNHTFSHLLEKQHVKKLQNNEMKIYLYGNMYHKNNTPYNKYTPFVCTVHLIIKTKQ